LLNLAKISEENFSCLEKNLEERVKFELDKLWSFNRNRNLSILDNFILLRKFSKKFFD